MNFEQLCFTTFCVGSLADALKMSAGKVYGMLRSSGILTGYLLPGYEVLHTFSKEYIVDDLISYMKRKEYWNETVSCFGQGDRKSRYISFT